MNGNVASSSFHAYVVIANGDRWNPQRDESEVLVLPVAVELVRWVIVNTSSNIRCAMRWKGRGEEVKAVAKDICENPNPMSGEDHPI